MYTEQNQKTLRELVPELSNYRLELKRIELDEASEILELSVYDGFFAKNEADARMILEKIDRDMLQGDSIHWGIYLNTTHEIVGTCGFYKGFSENIGEIGYILKKTYRGLGIMTEAVKLVVGYGVNQKQLTNVTAFADASNQASIAVLKRAGFHQVEESSEVLKFARF